VNEAELSLISDAATVIASGVPDGEELQALADESPAATATDTPESDSAATALFSAWLFPTLSDMFATDGSGELLRTQSTPAITSAVVPEPVAVEQNRLTAA
jgi:hypothetical protein